MKEPSHKRAGRQEKEKKILFSLVEQYLKTGKPVGSQTLQEEACGEVHEHLQHQHRAIVLHAKYGKRGSQKRRISRQADVRGGNLIRTAQAVNAMLQPVLGDVAVDEGIGGDGRETKQEQEPQPQGGERDPQKKSEVLAHELAHAKNIPQGRFT